MTGALTTRLGAWRVGALLPLLGIFILAARVTDPGPRPAADEGPLLSYAARLLDGSYAVPGTHNATAFLWHGPGLPVVMAPFVALHANLGVIRMLGPALLFGAVLGFHRVLSRHCSPRRALLGAWALGLYAPAWSVLGSTHKEPLAMLLVVVAMAGTLRYLHRGARRDLAIGGLALAGLAMTRLEYGWEIVAFLVVAGAAAFLRPRAGYGRLAAVCSVAVLACVPWLTYTYALTGHPFYWGNAGSLSLFWMSAPTHDQLVQWHSWRHTLTQPSLAAYRPEVRRLAPLDPLQRDLALQHLAWLQASAHPAKFAVNLGANVGRMWAGLPFSFRLPALLLAPLWACNLALLGGLGRAARRAWRARAARGTGIRADPAGRAFAAFAVVGIAVHLLPSAEPRMILPLVPVLIWLAMQSGRLGSREPNPA
ncbi:MAG: hypothetical protein QOE08_673 [Thermoleophilaceae bacterium]|nr:hypothetical protein [Thermoleophilaceae bacterium]